MNESTWLLETPASSPIKVRRGLFDHEEKGKEEEQESPPKGTFAINDLLFRKPDFASVEEAKERLLKPKLADVKPQLVISVPKRITYLFKLTKSFDHMVTTYTLTEKELMKLLLASNGENSSVRELILTSLRHEQPYEHLMTALTGFVWTSSTPLELQNKFHSCKQRSAEPLQDFIQRLNEAYLPVSDLVSPKALVQVFVNNLNSRFMNHGSNAALIASAVEGNSDDFQKVVNDLYQKVYRGYIREPSHNGSNSNSRQSDNKKPSRMKCGNCGRHGHLSKDCQQPDKKAPRVFSKKDNSPNEREKQEQKKQTEVNATTTPATGTPKDLLMVPMQNSVGARLVSLDTMANINVVEQRLVSNEALRPSSLSAPIVLGNGTTSTPQFETDVTLSISENVSVNVRCQVVEGFTKELLIGLPTLVSMGIEWSAKRGTVSLMGSTFRYHSPAVEAIDRGNPTLLFAWSSEHDQMPDPVLPSSEDEDDIPPDLISSSSCASSEDDDSSPPYVDDNYFADDDDAEEEDGQFEEQLQSLLDEFSDCFAEEALDSPGAATGAIHCIPTGDARPIQQPVRQMPKARQDWFVQLVKEREAQGFIRKSTSAWRANPVIVTKKDGSPRDCIDYTDLNAVTIAQASTLQSVSTQLSKIDPKSCVYIIMDMIQGFHQFIVAEEDRHKTAFYTPIGLYEWNVMPFGLKGAPQTFNSYVRDAFAELEPNVLTYLDDLLVQAQSKKQALSLLRKVLEIAREKNLKFKLSKCQFLKANVNYLGYRLGGGTISKAPHLVNAMAQFPEPRSLKEAQRFMGLANFYRNFVPKFEEIAAPIRSAMSNSTSRKFTWPDEARVAFKALKFRLCEQMELFTPDWGKEFILRTDASDVAMGAVLLQYHDGQEKPIAFLSKTYTKAQKNYSVIEKEALAIVHFLHDLRYYTIGRRIIVQSDHKPLQWLLGQNRAKTSNRRLIRWLLELQEYDIVVEYRPGAQNQDADALSRVNMELKELSDREVLTLEHQPLTQDISKAQAADVECRALLHALQTSELPKGLPAGLQARLQSNFKKLLTQLVVQDNVLYFRPDVDRPKLLYVPMSFRRQLLDAAHGSPMGGHAGAERTYSRVKRFYYWKGMRKDIETYVKSCSSCTKTKVRYVPSYGLLQPLQVTAPFERCAIDLVGPLPETARGMRYILTFQDAATRYHIFTAIPSKDATVVAKTLLEKVICVFGSPQEWLSDNGKEFDNAVMERLNHLLGIQHALTTPYHPQANGQLERSHSTLNDQLRMLVDSEQRDWDEFLPYVQHSMNTLVNAATGYSPHFLMFGRDLVEPIDILMSAPLQPEIPVDMWLQKLKLSRAIAAKNDADAKALSKSKVDTKRKPFPFKAGQKVYVIWPAKTNEAPPGKLAPKSFGPFVIEKFLDKHNLIVQVRHALNEEEVHRSHVDRLVPITSEPDNFLSEWKVGEENAPAKDDDEQPPLPAPPVTPEESTTIPDDQASDTTAVISDDPRDWFDIVFHDRRETNDGIEFLVSPSFNHTPKWFPIERLVTWKDQIMVYEQDEPDLEWHVESIIQQRGRGRHTRYRVRWRHYPPEFDTWEDAAALKGERALRAWKRRKASKSTRH